MKVEISVPEIMSIFKEIQEQPEKPFEMIRVDAGENVGEYLSGLNDMERTNFLAGNGMNTVKEMLIIAMVPILLTSH